MSAIDTHLAIIRSAAHELELEADRFERESGTVPIAVPVARDTIPAPAPEHEAEPPIPAGKARMHLAGAFVDVLLAIDRARMVADALARALDATAKPTGTP